jgi:hypothetical protein
MPDHNFEQVFAGLTADEMCVAMDNAESFGAGAASRRRVADPGVAILAAAHESVAGPKLT